MTHFHSASDNFFEFTLNLKNLYIKKQWRLSLQSEFFLVNICESNFSSNPWFPSSIWRIFYFVLKVKPGNLPENESTTGLRKTTSVAANSFLFNGVKIYFLLITFFILICPFISVNVNQHYYNNKNVHIINRKSNCFKQQHSSLGIEEIFHRYFQLC